MPHRLMGAAAVAGLLTVSLFGSSAFATVIASAPSRGTGVVTGGIEPRGMELSSARARALAPGVVAAVRGKLTTRSVSPGESVAVIPTGPTVRASVRPGGRFHFVLASGDYVLHVIKSGRNSASDWAPIAVTVRKGSTVKVMIPSGCK